MNQVTNYYIWSKYYITFCYLVADKMRSLYMLALAIANILNLFLGLGCGLSANITIKNCCLYYPKKKGLINACIMSLGALVGSSYTLIGERTYDDEPSKKIIDSFIEACREYKNSSN